MLSQKMKRRRTCNTIKISRKWSVPGGGSKIPKKKVKLATDEEDEEEEEDNFDEEETEKLH